MGSRLLLLGCAVQALQTFLDMAIGEHLFALEKIIDFDTNEKIENGVLPGLDAFDGGPLRRTNRRARYLVDGKNVVEEPIRPHTNIFVNRLIKYRHPENMRAGVRVISPVVDRDLLFAAGAKIAKDCLEGFCGYMKGRHKKKWYGGDDSESHHGNYMRRTRSAVAKAHKDFGADHVITGIPSDSDENHMHYEKVYPEELYKRVRSPLHHERGNLHIHRPEDYDRPDAAENYYPQNMEFV